jgi:leucine-rich repeat kinase 2
MDFSLLFFKQKPKALNSSEMHRLNAYIYKNYPRLGESIRENDSNFKCGIPVSIFTLINLVSLNLSYHGITQIPDDIERLVHLKELLLDNCIRLESLSGKIADLPLIKIGLANCLSLKTPPVEISRRGTQSILSYMKHLSSGSVQCKRTKLMLVGLGWFLLFV